MAQKVKKTEHSGPKKGRGAYRGRKKVAKKESNSKRRQFDLLSGKGLTRQSER